MTSGQMRTRFWIETLCAVLGGGLFVLTLFTRDWIEIAFGVDPDRGSGALEIGLSVALLAVAVVSATLARREWQVAHEHQ